MPTEIRSAHEVRSTAAQAAPNPSPSRPQSSPQEIAQRLLERLREDSRLQEEFTRFHKAKNRRAISYAFKILGNDEDAEDAVSRTYLELLQGKTDAQHFFNALRRNCLNKLESAKREGAVILRIGELKSDLQGEEGEEMDDESFLESISSRHDAQDPATLVLAQEEIRDALKIIRKDPRFRWVRQKKWWRELELRNEIASGAEE